MLSDADVEKEITRLITFRKTQHRVAVVEPEELVVLYESMENPNHLTDICDKVAKTFNGKK